MKEPQFLFVDIEGGYIIKYDGYRDKNHWTLLRKTGGRIFDGSFTDVVRYLAKECSATYFKEKEYCEICGRLLFNGKCIKEPHSSLEGFENFESEVE